MKPPGAVRTALQAIGNTPLVRLHRVVPDGCGVVLVKLEYFNPTGSYKDRMALAMVEEAERRGDLRPGMSVVEYTGGSTGSSLAFVCAVKGYEAIGRELAGQVDGPIHAFCASVGTAAMLMGVARVLRPRTPPTRIVALEPATSAVISGGAAGTHHVEGIGIGFLPPLLDRALLDEARGIDEGEARRMARRMAKEEGVFAGTSSGMNVVGALQLARELGPGHTVVTVAVDTGLKYLAGELYREEGS
jgi:cysteine synthase